MHHCLKDVSFVMTPALLRLHCRTLTLTMTPELLTHILLVREPAIHAQTRQHCCPHAKPHCNPPVFSPGRWTEGRHCPLQQGQGQGGGGVPSQAGQRPQHLMGTGKKGKVTRGCAISGWTAPTAPDGKGAAVGLHTAPKQDRSNTTKHGRVARAGLRLRLLL